MEHDDCLYPCDFFAMSWKNVKVVVEEFQEIKNSVRILGRLSRFCPHLDPKDKCLAALIDSQNLCRGL